MCHFYATVPLRMLVHKEYWHPYASLLDCSNSVLILAKHSETVVINVIANSMRKLIALSSEQDMNTAKITSTDSE